MMCNIVFFATKLCVTSIRTIIFVQTLKCYSEYIFTVILIWLRNVVNDLISNIERYIENLNYMCQS